MSRLLQYPGLDGLRQFNRPLFARVATERSPLTPDAEHSAMLTVPTASLLERYQGAFMGATLGLGADSSRLALFPWDSLWTIMTAYERSEYRDHAQSPFFTERQGWSMAQGLLAEVLWKSLDHPISDIGPGLWLRHVLDRWRSLAQNAGVPTQVLADLAKHREDALGLLEQRASLGQWKNWSHHHSLGIWRQHWEEDLLTATGERTLLEDRDLWVILGILSRTDGDCPTAIAQAKTLLCSGESMALGWIGATIGLMWGVGFPLPTALLGASIPVSSSTRLERAQQMGTQCFTQWAGIPPESSATGLTPWAITLSQ